MNNPQHSDQREWTPQSVKAIIGVALSVVSPTDAFSACKRLSDAHNTALATERRARFDEQLTAERQRREQAEENHRDLQQVCEVQLELIDSLKVQLLSALAAIEKHNKNSPSMRNIDIDPSALHEHDAELTEKVREPLVNALEELLDTSKEVDGSFPTEAHLNARRTAVRLLAKAKQNK